MGARGLAMAILDLFNEANDPQKYGRTPPPPSERHAPPIDKGTQGLHLTLPRGVPGNREKGNREAQAHWASPAAMATLSMPEQHDPVGRPPLPLGSFNGRLVGYNDDRLQITVAGPRAGKSSTVLIPTLLTYPGSMFVTDPKGELAIKTARHRAEALRQNVVVLDPFGVTGIPSGCFNPLDELDLASPRIVDDAHNLAQAIVVADANSKDDSFWTEGGRELLTGVILSVLQLPPAHRNLVTVRQLLTGAHPWLRGKADRQQFKSDAARAAFMENLLLTEMAKASAADTTTRAGIVEVITAIGEMYGAMPERMRGSMLATARIATRFLDSLGMRDILQASHFRLSDLRERNTTIYLVLPAGNETKAHFRWLRIMFEQATSRLIRMGEYPRDRAPIIFMLEEFPVLGYLETIENAAAYMPSYGIKLHLVAQSIVQLQNNYPRTWHSFFNGAGVSQFFANADDVTLDYISKRLGSLTFERRKSQFSDKNEDNRVTHPLLAPYEIEKYFARQYNDQIIFIPGENPFAMMRMTHNEVERLRLNMVHGGRMLIDQVLAPMIGTVPPADPRALQTELKQRRRRPPQEPLPA